MRGDEKYTFWNIKKTTAPFQLKLILDTNDAVAVDSIYEPDKIKKESLRIFDALIVDILGETLRL